MILLRSVVDDDVKTMSSTYNRMYASSAPFLNSNKDVSVLLMTKPSFIRNFAKCALQALGACLRREIAFRSLQTWLGCCLLTNPGG